MSKLSHDEIASRLEKLPGWRHRGNAIEKQFDCENFDGSMEFAIDVAAAANASNHHPDTTICWNRVTLTLSSHDADGITERDFKLAAAADAIAAKRE